MSSSFDEISPTNHEIYVTWSATLSAFGFVNNTLFLVVILIKRLKSRYTMYILCNQCVIDATICLLTLLKILIPETSTGVYVLDLMSCMFWTAQYFVWVAVLASVYNLLFTALDRYWAVVQPRSYKKAINRKITLSLLFIYIFPAIYNWEAFAVMRIINGTCTEFHENMGEKYLAFSKFYSTLWFVVQYLFPAITMITLYWKIYTVMRMLQPSKTDSGHTNRSFTRATMIVVVIFIVTFSYDSFYYTLGILGAVSYTLDTPLQLIGVFLISLNSSMNVFVYLVTMKSFRRMYASVWFRYIRRSNVVDLDDGSHL